MLTYKPQPGDIGLAKIHGLTGAFVAFGQLLIGDASRYTHAFIVIDDERVAEAEPGGARYGSLQKYIAEGAVFSSHVQLTPEQRAMIVATAEGLIEAGTPYSFLDYVALALHRIHIRPKFIEDYVASSGHMICSQMADFCWQQASVHLFSDCRLPQDVSPGDIANALIEEW